MSKENENKVLEEEMVNPVDLILDPENEENIFLYDEDDNAVEFVQHGHLTHNDEIYVFLKQIVDGEPEEEGQVFVLREDEEGNTNLYSDIDDETFAKVVELYNELLENSEE